MFHIFIQEYSEHILSTWISNLITPWSDDIFYIKPILWNLVKIDHVILSLHDHFSTFNLVKCIFLNDYFKVPHNLIRSNLLIMLLKYIVSSLVWLIDQLPRDICWSNPLIGYFSISFCGVLKFFALSILWLFLLSA